MTLPACLVAIVLLMDMSGSVPEPLYAAQRDGAAAALEDARLIRTLEGSDGIAVMVADFDSTPRTRLAWTLLRTGEEARSFAASLRALRRNSRSGVTAVGRALGFEESFRAKVIFELTGLDPFAAPADPR
jgi:hypothetical protein